MYRIIVLMMIVFSAVTAQGILEPAYGLWSVGLTVKERNYKHVETRYSPAPLIFGGYGPVWIEANRIGYTFLRSNGWFASVAMQIRSHQFRKEDKGYEDRPSAIEAGVQVGRHLWKRWVVRLALLQDISGRHNSREADLQLYSHFFPGPFSLLTAAGLQYQTAALGHYYYGSETYKPKAGFVTELESILTLPVGKWGVYIGARYWFFDRQAAESPLVAGNKVANIFAGIGYYFD